MRNEILGDNMRNIVFLDIDGVLNGDRTCIRSIFWFICFRLHITKFYRFLEKKFNWRNIYGWENRVTVHTDRVFDIRKNKC